MDARSIILRKRDGLELTSGELAYIVKRFTAGDIPKYQMSAWLMAVLLRGMSEDETHELTNLLVHSGRVLNPNDLPSPSADKHSTGGVGDKVSLALAPLVASAGVYVPMLSGRGLGHTGGTLDKLESIKGLRTDLSADEFISQVNAVGCCIASQSEEMTPADGKMYALRDVTGTVESLPLIVSSIVGKKVAEGAASLVFDVKWGRGAFMSEIDAALELASELVKEAGRFERKAIAFVTDMNQPLGNAVGNALELIEAIDLLRGCGPDDVTSATLLLGGAMLYLAGKAETIDEGAAHLRGLIRSGAAIERLGALVRAQGGDPTAIDDTSLLRVSSIVMDVTSDRDGYVGSIDTRGLGYLMCSMGGGRLRADETIDHGVGALLLKKEGDAVRKDEPLVKLYASDQGRSTELAQSVAALFDISSSPPEPRPLVPWIVTAEGREQWGAEKMPPQ